MKKLVFLCVVIVAISFTSCGGNNDTIVPENEKQEIFGIDKGDVPDPDGDDDEIDTSEN